MVRTKKVILMMVETVTTESLFFFFFSFISNFQKMETKWEKMGRDERLLLTVRNMGNIQFLMSVASKYASPKR